MAFVVNAVTTTEPVSVVTRYTRWLFAPVARARIARLRILVYGFIFIDVFVLRPWVADNGTLVPELYHALFIGRWLPVPVPTPLIVTIFQYSMLAFAAIAITGRLPWFAGWAVFVLYVEWMLIAFSYGKVDHDRFAFLVALAVLPSIGKAGVDDQSEDASTGWAIHCIQAAVVATYLLSVVAKVRYGGIDWVNGATLMRAILRRGTVLTDPLQTQPWLLQISQYMIVAFELGSPLMLMRNLVGRLYVAAAFLFHAAVFATLTIMFWPHLVCLFSFLPLERAKLRLHLSPRGRFAS